jgi:hypothetical protein
LQALFFAAVDFVDAYLKQYGYEGEKLYDQLRCSVVHAYTSSDNAFAFDLMHNNQQEQKTWSQPANRERLDLETFVQQLEQVLDQYLHDIKTDESIRILAIKNYQQFGIFSENP